MDSSDGLPAFALSFSLSKPSISNLFNQSEAHGLLRCISFTM
ncbi:MAG TPA: hypothetical protein VIY08_05020 [Candidatus Nitrosocosmicus sp.]